MARERLRIASFHDPEVAALAAALLESQGFDAEYLDQSGRGLTKACVLVRDQQTPLALSLLRRVSRGEFAEGFPGQPEDVEMLAIELTQALRGTHVTPLHSWRNLLPILFVVAFALAFWMSALWGR